MSTSFINSIGINFDGKINFSVLCENYIIY